MVHAWHKCHERDIASDGEVFWAGCSGKVRHVSMTGGYLVGTCTAKESKDHEQPHPRQDSKRKATLV